VPPGWDDAADVAPWYQLQYQNCSAGLLVGNILLVALGCTNDSVYYYYAHDVPTLN
jgi:hypothetical protein